jgi:hypothetical protein
VRYALRKRVLKACNKTPDYINSINWIQIWYVQFQELGLYYKAVFQKLKTIQFPTEFSMDKSLKKNKFPLLSEQLSELGNWYTNKPGVTKYLAVLVTYWRITKTYDYKQNSSGSEQ